MAVTCRLTLDYETQKEAEAVAKAVSVDNYQFMKTKVLGNQVVSTVESEKISSLIHTLDDFLACVGVAERVVKGK